MARPTRVRFQGPLFDDARRSGLFEKARRKAGARASAQVEATVRLKTPNRTGAYVRSIETVFWRGGRGFSVKATSRLPIKDWLETGRRRGVKLRKGNYMWRAGKRKAKSFDYQQVVGDEIARVLNGS